MFALFILISDLWLSCFLGCIKICAGVSYFVKFGQFGAQIRRYIYFQNVDVHYFGFSWLGILITWLLRMRVSLPPHSKFHLNGTICSWVIAKKWFSMRRPSAILNLLISEFFFVTVGKVSVCILNFVKFGRFAVQIWRYNDFQNDGRPPCWIFEIGHFHHLTFVCVRWCPRTRNFVLIGHYGAERKMILWFGVRPSSWIGEFLIFSHVSVAWDKICVRILNFVQFGRFVAELWRYNDFQNGGRPPCWIFEIWHFHHRTFLCVRLCLRTPNFVLIGQYEAEL